MKTFKEEIGDLSNMRSFKASKPVTGPKINKSLNTLKKSIENYYDVADKMLSSQLNVLNSNLDTFKNFEGLMELDRVKNLKKYVSDIQKQHEQLNILKTKFDSVKDNAIDFGIKTDNDKVINIEPFESLFKRIVKDTPLVSQEAPAVEKTEKSIEDAATQKEINIQSDVKPETKQTEPSLPDIKNVPSIEPISPIVKPETKQTSPELKPETGNSISPEIPTVEPSSIEPEIIPTDKVEPEIKNIPPVESNIKSTETPSDSIQTPIQKDIKNIKLDNAVQSDIKNYLTTLKEGNSIISDIDIIDEATQIKLSDILSDENIKILKSKTLNNEQIKNISKEIKNIVEKKHNYILGSKININDLLIKQPKQKSNVSIETTPISAPEPQLEVPKKQEPIVKSTPSIVQPKPIQPVVNTQITTQLDDATKEKIFNNKEFSDKLMSQYNTYKQNLEAYNRKDVLGNFKSDEKRKPYKDNMDNAKKSIEIIKNNIPELKNSSLEDILKLASEYSIKNI